MTPQTIVTFSREESPVVSPVGVNAQAARATTLADLASGFSFSNLVRVSVPRDESMPLVTGYNPSSHEAIEAYKSLRTRLLKSQATRGFRSVVVTSVGRAEGKTLTAFNLACCCAKVEKLSVLLIDSDMRNRTLTKFMDQMPSVGLADLISNRTTFEEAIVGTDLSNLYVMGAGEPDVAPAELFSTEKWSQIVEWSHQHFNLVLVDSLAVLSFTDFELIAPACDGILLVVKARGTSQEALTTTLAQLDAQKLVGVVWNASDY